MRERSAQNEGGTTGGNYKGSDCDLARNRAFGNILAALSNRRCPVGVIECFDMTNRLKALMERIERWPKQALPSI
jgi:hypothetical protein